MAIPPQKKSNLPEFKSLVMYSEVEFTEGPGYSIVLDSPPTSIKFSIS